MTFTAKVYKNVNGEEETHEFDNEKEYQEFVEKNKDLLPHHRTQSFVNFWDFGIRDLRKNAFDILPEPQKSQSLPDIDLAKYETALQNIKHQKEANKQKLEEINNTIERLKHYKKEFEKENKTDFVQEINEKIEQLNTKKKELS